MDEFIWFDSQLRKYLRNKPKLAEKYYFSVSNSYNQLIVGKHGTRLETIRARLEELTDVSGIGDFATVLARLRSQSGAKRADLAIGLHYLARVDEHFEAVVEEIERVLFNCTGSMDKAFKDKIGREPPKSLSSRKNSERDTAQWPNHVPPFKKIAGIPAELVNSPHADDGIWLNPHNYVSIALEGRDQEITQLNEFLNAKSQFLICAVIGPSGAGKTRLVSQWAQKIVPSHSELNWATVIATSRNELAWHDWKISENTIIIVDYTYKFGKVIRAIREISECQNEYKIRLLILDHVIPKSLFRDVFWSPLIQSQTDEDSARGGIIYWDSPIILKPEERNSRLIRGIISSSASLGGIKYDPDESNIIDAARSLYDMGEGAANPSAIRHPLFAAILGQAIRNGKSEFANWSRRDLVRHYLDKPTRLPWTGDGSDEPTQKIAMYAGALISAATLLRGIDFQTALESLPDDHLEGTTFIQPTEQIIQLANRIVSSTDDEVLKPFEPDILGEGFLIEFLLFCGRNETLLAEFFNMIAVQARIASEYGATANFREVIERLARNLSNDDQSLPEVRKGWRALRFLLVPHKFPANSAFRQVVSLVILSLISKHSSSKEFSERYTAALEREIDMLDVLSELRSRLRSTRVDLYTGDSLKLREIEVARRENELFEHFDEVISFVAMNSISEDFRETFFQHLLVMLDDFEAIGSSVVTNLAFNVRVLCAKHLFKFRHFKAALKLAKKLNFDCWCLNFHESRYRSFQNLRRIFDFYEEIHNITGISVVKCQVQNEIVAALMSRSQVAPLEIGLSWASNTGNLNVVKYLVEETDVELDSPVEDYLTPVQWASSGGHLGVVQYLISAGADLNKNSGRSALMYSVSKNNREIVDALLLGGGDPNFFGFYDGGQTALLLACEEGLLEVAKRLIDGGADPNYIKLTHHAAEIVYRKPKIVETPWSSEHIRYCESGETALYVAAEQGHEALAIYLLDHTRDFDAQSLSSDKTPFYWACSQRLWELAERLLKMGANPVRDWGHMPAEFPLLCATAGNRVELVSSLLKAGVDPNEWTFSGVTSLMVAGVGGNMPLVQMLLDAGALAGARLFYEDKSDIEVVRASGNEAIASLLESSIGWST